MSKTTDKRLVWLSIAVFCALLVWLQINTSVWFRTRTADSCRDRRQYARAIRIYEKILRRNSVKKDLDPKSFAEINFKLGYSASMIGLTNMAIESYARGEAEYADFDLKGYRDGTDLGKDRLSAVGLLEAGRFDRAVKEFRLLKERYPDFSEAGRYINTAMTLLARQGPLRRDENFFFSIGDAYIAHGLFDEARSFFTKRILDYGVEPVKVLKYLDKRYSARTEVKDRVWGGNIYVTLEDFENVDPALAHARPALKSTVNDHGITGSIAHKGRYSEFLDVGYVSVKDPGWVYDYWAKAVMIPIDKSGLRLGLRLFIKSEKALTPSMGHNYIYPRSGRSGLCSCETRRPAGDGWREEIAGDLRGNAEGIANMREDKWDTEDVFINKVIVDTKCVPGKFYVDDIELYIE